MTFWNYWALVLLEVCTRLVCYLVLYDYFVVVVVVVIVFVVFASFSVDSENKEASDV